MHKEIIFLIFHKNLKKKTFIDEPKSYQYIFTKKLSNQEKQMGIIFLNSHMRWADMRRHKYAPNGGALHSAKARPKSWLGLASARLSYDWTR